ncbi:hypothetical protein JCM16303_004976 [Sporobolomyces ruberrimus]
MSTLPEDRDATKADVYWLVGWTAVLLWDNIITIAAAHRYLMKAKSTPMKGLYILNRYGTVILQTLCMLMVVLAVPMNLCRSIFWFQAFALVFVIVLVLMLAIQLGLLIGTVTQLRPLILTPGKSVILDFHGCVAVAASPAGRQLSLIFWITSLVFNFSIFAMTMWRSIKLTRRIGQHLSIFRRLMKGGILYYTVILATNIGCVAFYAQTTKPLQTFNTPASVVLVSLMSSRLIVSLWSENYRSSRLSIDTFATLRTPRTGGRTSPFSPKSGYSERRRDSNDYDKVGPFETKIDFSDFKASLPTLAYSGGQYHGRSASIHSMAGSVSRDQLPTFDGMVVRENPFEEIKLDSRSVKSEGANKNKGKGSGSRDGAASV